MFTKYAFLFALIYLRWDGRSAYRILSVVLRILVILVILLGIYCISATIFSYIEGGFHVLKSHECNLSYTQPATLSQ